ncbi:MAG TPA: glycosyltransferase, partial [Pseudonocardia sp.]|nr:glycosyltransferase [Pseudonocardia sp.]
MRSPLRRPLRILIGAETYPPDVNGAARFAERLAAGMAGRGHEVHVVTPSPSGPPSREVRDGITVHGVRSHRYFRHEHFQVCMPWEAGPATATLLAEIDPDVVHTQAHMVVGRGVVKAAHRAGRPLVATNHLMPENLLAYSPIPPVLRGVAATIGWKDLGRIFGKADAVTAPTPRAVELLVRRAGLAEAFPVSCGIDADRYRATPKVPGAVPTVLFVGRLDQEKRVDELIRAFAALPAELPAQLEIIGDGGRRDE